METTFVDGTTINVPQMLGATLQIGLNARAMIVCVCIFLYVYLFRGLNHYTVEVNLAIMSEQTQHTN